MLEILRSLLFANCLYIIGLHNAARFEYLHDDMKDSPIVEGSKMILWRVRLFCLKHFGKFYSKGLITCPPCMALTHSTYIFWPVMIHLYGFSHWLLLYYVIYVGVLSAVNMIAVNLIELIEAIKDKCWN